MRFGVQWMDDYDVAKYMIDVFDTRLIVEGLKEIPICHDLYHKNWRYNSSAKCLLSYENGLAILDYRPFLQENGEGILCGIALLRMNSAGIVQSVFWQGDHMSEPKNCEFNFIAEAKGYSSVLAEESVIYIASRHGNATLTPDEKFQEKGSPAKKKLMIVSGFERNPKIVAAALNRAQGRCENPKCKHPESFRRRDGETYLEVHHKTPLALGGSDALNNVIALCANCHRERHYGYFEA